jgi:hypothetical protein
VWQMQLFLFYAMCVSLIEWYCFRAKLSLVYTVRL